MDNILEKTDTPVRWGIVGLGGVVVGRIAPALLSCPGSQLLACTGHTPEKTLAFAQKFGVERVYRSHLELVNDSDVDAVYIATPNALHAEQSISAARAGKHILCEKPLALTVEDGRRIVEAKNNGDGARFRGASRTTPKRSERIKCARSRIRSSTF